MRCYDGRCMRYKQNRKPTSLLLLPQSTFALFGLENWKILTIIWALIPLYNTPNFINCPIERLTEDGESMGIKNLLKTPIFWLMILLMICTGATVSPAMVGSLAEMAGGNLKSGLLAATGFPVILVVCLIILGRAKKIVENSPYGKYCAGLFFWLNRPSTFSVPRPLAFRRHLC